MYIKLTHFSRNLKCAIVGLYLSITEFTPNSCQSKAQGLCPVAWTLSHYSGTCVSVPSDLVDQSTARSQCKGLGADIVTILSSEMNVFLHDYLKTKQVFDGVWLGLRRQNGELRWLDSDDEPWYFNWYSEAREPTGEDCVQINRLGTKDNKTWMEVNCNLNAAYICEKLQSQRCPLGWIWSDSSWTCIKLFLNELNWTEARDACEFHEGDLLVIQDEEMNNFLGEVLSDHKYDYWIGLKDNETDGVLRWLDNDEEAQYVKMVLNSSNNGDCVEVRSPLEGWSQKLCQNRSKFICEIVTECPESNYGIGCSLNCSKNCGGPKNSCDFKNGTCTHGCKEGYIGEMCDTADGKRNGTLIIEEDVSREPKMMAAYLSALVFAAVVLGFCLIPLFSGKNDDLEFDSSQEYEPEQLGDYEGDNGVSYYWEEDFRSGNFWQEDFSRNDRSSFGEPLYYWQDEELHV